MLITPVLLAFAASVVPATELIEVDGPALRRVIRKTDARITVVNVWATWCEPCKEEFPDLVAVAKAYAPRGVRLLFVSTDFGDARPEAVKFLKAQGAKLPSYVQTGKDEPFIEALSPDWVGTLPSTFIFDAHGERKGFFQGKVERAALEEALDRLLATPDRGEKP